MLVRSIARAMTEILGLREFPVVIPVTELVFKLVTEFHQLMEFRTPLTVEALATDIDLVEQCLQTKY